ncbi:hypothetical protein CFC21_075375 [Triticum aestivum]|uniref:J domain-containing protein n=2 Tax=Triticum aestivum TaxID=4565 RepID=A0A9R1HRJ9_WHEAT|nr:hypothetical protein CFC21_075375 [Triticum aestivum]CAJ15413.1 unnamed protein product [Triticum aestivum]
MEAVKKKQLQAQLEAADILFAAGDLRRAKMHVDMAVAMDRSGACPEAQRARAAYRVLAAANSNKADHYGVLGVAAPPGGRPTKESHDAVKAQHKALCDAFEADKSSAAVAGALKLVKQAFAALTDIRKNEGAVPGAARAAAPARHRLPPLLPVPRPKARPAAAPVRVVLVGEQQVAADYPAAAAFVDEPVAPEQKVHGVVANEEEEEEDYYAGGGGRGGRR